MRAPPVWGQRARAAPVVQVMTYPTAAAGAGRIKVQMRLEVGLASRVSLRKDALWDCVAGVFALTAGTVLIFPGPGAAAAP